MKFFVVVAAISLLLVTFANVQKEETKTPVMVSFTVLKWTALPERPGLQFAILSGATHKPEPTRRCA